MRNLRAILRGLLRAEYGQDLSDYCLLTALVALIALGVFIHMSGGIKSIWNIGNTTLNTGQSAAGGASSGSGTIK